MIFQGAVNSVQHRIRLDRGITVDVTETGIKVEVDKVMMWMSTEEAMLLADSINQAMTTRSRIGDLALTKFFDEEGV